MTKQNRFTLVLAVATAVAALAMPMEAHADPIPNNGPNNPSPGVLYPQAGSKICANHSMYPVPGMKQTYKACAVGTWGAPSIPDPLP